MGLKNNLHVWRLCARHQRVLAARSRWAHLFTAVFAALVLAVAASGYILSGGMGVQDFARTTASLVQLMLLIVPVVALVFAIQGIGSDADGAEFLFSQPVPRAVVLLGSVAGLFEALFAAELIGFAAGGFVIFSFAGDEGITGFVLLVAGAAATTLLFVSAGALIAAGSPGRRARAMAIGLLLWFGAVLLYDLLLLGISTMLRSGAATKLLVLGVIVNPVDAIRTGLLMAIEGTAAFGTASLAFLRFTGGAAYGFALLTTTVCAWVVLTLWLAARRLSRVDL